MKMKNTFQHHIDGDLPVVVDFFADWCAPCKSMLPVLSNVKHVVGETATILKMNIDKNRFYANQFSIHSIPTLIIFKKGKVIWRKSGVASAGEIIKQLAPL
jgi:thioredoxin 1